MSIAWAAVDPSDQTFGAVVGAVGLALLVAAGVRGARERAEGIQPGTWVLVLMGVLMATVGLLAAVGAIAPEPVR